MHQSLINRMNNEHMRAVSIDLFSGPGGLCTGFKWAGILPLIAVEWTDSTVLTYSKSHGSIIFELSEYEKDTNYLNNFLIDDPRSILIHGDINLVTNELIRQLLLIRYGIDSNNETVDVVSGGAPCESFSMAGTRTEGDERDDLFSNIVRIARATKTKKILFENVKGMFSKPRNGVKGAIFQDICDEFERKEPNDPNFISYTLSSREQNTILLKACDYGVPQLRERLFLVSIRDDLYNQGIRFNYPARTHGPGCPNPYVTISEALSDLPAVQSNQEITTYTLPNAFINNNQTNFVNIMRGNPVPGMNTVVPNHLNNIFTPNSLSSHKGPGHIIRKQALLSIIPPNSSMKAEYQRLEREDRLDEQVPGYPQFSYRELFPNTIYGSRNRRLKNNEPSFTVTSHCLDELLHPTQNRAITPREAARLQSFPDWYIFEGPYVQFHGSAEQDRYEQIGDAIPPLLAYALAQNL